MPKGDLQVVTDRDGGSCIENIHISLGTRVTGTHPNFARVFPLKPWPTQAQGRRKLIQVERTETAKLLGPTHQLPINLAFCPGSSVLGRL